MPTLLIVDRTGTVKPLATKTYEEDILYKKAGFKTPTDFALHHVFSMGSYRVHLYGKTKGKAGQENKYDFPPPVDNVLFFGSCLLVNKREEGEVTDLPLKDWKSMYEKLFGGFEDLTAGEAGESETEEEKRIMADPKTKFTKQGYVKDDFIVDDDEEEDDEEDEEEESASFSDDSDDRPRPKKKAAPKTKKAPVTRAKKAAAATARRARKEPVVVSEEPNAAPVLQDELAEEEYFA